MQDCWQILLTHDRPLLGRDEFGIDGGSIFVFAWSI
jgi:hypothetical protein